MSYNYCREIELPNIEQVFKKNINKVSQAFMYENLKYKQGEDSVEIPDRDRWTYTASPRIEGFSILPSFAKYISREDQALRQLFKEPGKYEFKFSFPQQFSLIKADADSIELILKLFKKYNFLIEKSFTSGYTLEHYIQLFQYEYLFANLDFVYNKDKILFLYNNYRKIPKAKSNNQLLIDELFAIYDRVDVKDAAPEKIREEVDKKIIEVAKQYIEDNKKTVESLSSAQPTAIEIALQKKMLYNLLFVLFDLEINGNKLDGFSAMNLTIKQLPYNVFSNYFLKRRQAGNVEEGQTDYQTSLFNQKIKILLKYYWMENDNWNPDQLSDMLNLPFLLKREKYEQTYQVLKSEEMVQDMNDIKKQKDEGKIKSEIEKQLTDALDLAGQDESFNQLLQKIYTKYEAKNKGDTPTQTQLTRNEFTKVISILKLYHEKENYLKEKEKNPNEADEEKEKAYDNQIKEETEALVYSKPDFQHIFQELFNLETFTKKFNELKERYKYEPSYTKLFNQIQELLDESKGKFEGFFTECNNNVNNIMIVKDSKPQLNETQKRLRERYFQTVPTQKIRDVIEEIGEKEKEKIFVAQMEQFVVKKLAINPNKDLFFIQDYTTFLDVISYYKVVPLDKYIQITNELNKLAELSIFPVQQIKLQTLKKQRSYFYEAKVKHAGLDLEQQLVINKDSQIVTKEISQDDFKAFQEFTSTNYFDNLFLNYYYVDLCLNTDKYYKSLQKEIEEFKKQVYKLDAPSKHLYELYFDNEVIKNKLIFQKYRDIFLNKDNLNIFKQVIEKNFMKNLSCAQCQFSVRTLKNVQADTAQNEENKESQGKQKQVYECIEPVDEKQIPACLEYELVTEGNESAYKCRKYNQSFYAIKTDMPANYGVFKKDDFLATLKNYLHMWGNGKSAKPLYGQLSSYLPHLYFSPIDGLSQGDIQKNYKYVQEKLNEIKSIVDSDQEDGKALNKGLKVFITLLNDMYKDSKFFYISKEIVNPNASEPEKDKIPKIFESLAKKIESNPDKKNYYIQCPLSLSKYSFFQGADFKESLVCQNCKNEAGKIDSELTCLKLLVNGKPEGDYAKYNITQVKNCTEYKLDESSGSKKYVCNKCLPKHSLQGGECRKVSSSEGKEYLENCDKPHDSSSALVTGCKMCMPYYQIATQYVDGKLISKCEKINIQTIKSSQEKFSQQIEKQNLQVKLNALADKAEKLDELESENYNIISKLIFSDEYDIYNLQSIMKNYQKYQKYLSLKIYSYLKLQIKNSQEEDNSYELQKKIILKELYEYQMANDGQLFSIEEVDKKLIDILSSKQIFEQNVQRYFKNFVLEHPGKMTGKESQELQIAIYSYFLNIVDYLKVGKSENNQIYKIYASIIKNRLIPLREAVKKMKGKEQLSKMEEKVKASLIQMHYFLMEIIQALIQKYSQTKEGEQAQLNFFNIKKQVIYNTFEGRVEFNDHYKVENFTVEKIKQMEEECITLYSNIMGQMMEKYLTELPDKILRKIDQYEQEKENGLQYMSQITDYLKNLQIRESMETKRAFDAILLSPEQQELIQVGAQSFDASIAKLRNEMPQRIIYFNTLTVAQENGESITVNYSELMNQIKEYSQKVINEAKQAEDKQKYAQMLNILANITQNFQINQIFSIAKLKVYLLKSFADKLQMYKVVLTQDKYDFLKDRTGFQKDSYNELQNEFRNTKNIIGKIYNHMNIIEDKEQASKILQQVSESNKVFTKYIILINQVNKEGGEQLQQIINLFNQISQANTQLIMQNIAVLLDQQEAKIQQTQNELLQMQGEKIALKDLLNKQLTGQQKQKISMENSFIDQVEMTYQEQFEGLRKQIQNRLDVIENEFSQKDELKEALESEEFVNIKTNQNDLEERIRQKMDYIKQSLLQYQQVKAIFIDNQFAKSSQIKQISEAFEEHAKKETDEDVLNAFAEMPILYEQMKSIVELNKLNEKVLNDKEKDTFYEYRMTLLTYLNISSENSSNLFSFNIYDLYDECLSYEKDNLFRILFNYNLYYYASIFSNKYEKLNNTREKVEKKSNHVINIVNELSNYDNLTNNLVIEDEKLVSELQNNINVKVANYNSKLEKQYQIKKQIEQYRYDLSMYLQKPTGSVAISSEQLEEVEKEKGSLVEKFEQIMESLDMNTAAIEQLSGQFKNLFNNQDLDYQQMTQILYNLQEYYNEYAKNQEQIQLYIKTVDQADEFEKKVIALQNTVDSGRTRITTQDINQGYNQLIANLSEEYYNIIIQEKLEVLKKEEENKKKSFDDILAQVKLTLKESKFRGHLEDFLDNYKIENISKVDEDHAEFIGLYNKFKETKEDGVFKKSLSKQIIQCQKKSIATSEKFSIKLQSAFIQTVQDIMNKKIQNSAIDHFNKIKAIQKSMDKLKESNEKELKAKNEQVAANEKTIKELLDKIEKLKSVSSGDEQQKKKYEEEIQKLTKQFQSQLEEEKKKIKEVTKQQNQLQEDAQSNLKDILDNKKLLDENMNMSLEIGKMQERIDQVNEENERLKKDQASIQQQLQDQRDQNLAMQAANEKNAILLGQKAAQQDKKVIIYALAAVVVTAGIALAVVLIILKKPKGEDAGMAQLLTQDI